MEREKILLELMYDWIEKILTERENEIWTLYRSSLKPRDIAEKLNVSTEYIRVRLFKIKKKIKKHEKWLEEVKKLRGLSL
jgi:RNA polymerase sigma factor (sigma-70 family)